MSIREKIERMMMAISFAEAGEHETAREILKEQRRARRSKRTTVRPRPRKQLRAPSIDR